MGDSQALGLFVQVVADESRVLTRKTQSLADIRAVVAIEGAYLQVAPIGSSSTQRIRRLVHVEAEVGDEVLVQRVADRWVVTGVFARGAR